MKLLTLTEVLDLKLQDGDCLMVSTKKWTLPSETIQFVTQGEFNHAALISMSGDEPTVIEADTHKGIVERPITFYQDEKVYGLLVMRPIYMQNGNKYTKAVGHAVIIEARKDIGKKYDFTGILGFGIELVNDLTHKWWAKAGEWLFKKRNPFQSRARYFCSEHVITSYRSIGVAVCNGTTPASASPNDIYRDVMNGMMIVTDEKDNDVVVYNTTRKTWSKKMFLDEKI